MKNKFDRILLGILWVLAIALGVSFWFGSQYGFNLFSGAHWRHLAYMQASQSPIRMGFYLSLTVATVVMLVGLYLIVRPRFRKIRLPIVQTAPKAPTSIAPQPQMANTPVKTITQAPAIKHTNTPNIPSTEITRPAQQTHTAQPVPATPPPAPRAPYAGTRPPRLNLGINVNTPPATPPAPTPNIAPSVPITPPPAPIAPVAPSAPTTKKEYPEISEIFANAGYVIKKTPQIDNVPISLLAIGTGENMWIGAVGIRTTELRTVMDKMSQVFSDTLEDIYININGFVIAALDADTSEFQDILKFPTIDALREYIATVPNPPVPDDDDGNFAAYSEYIDTVITYIGKI